MWFYLPVYSVPAPPSGTHVDFNNTQLLSDTLVEHSLSLGAANPLQSGRNSNADESLCAGLFNLPHHFSSQDNWVILTNPAQELSGSMEMFSVWVLIFSATFLLRDSMTVWRQPQPWGRVDSKLWRHSSQMKRTHRHSSTAHHYSRPCAFMLPYIWNNEMQADIFTWIHSWRRIYDKA